MWVSDQMEGEVNQSEKPMITCLLLIPSEPVNADQGKSGFDLLVRQEGVDMGMKTGG